MATADELLECKNFLVAYGGGYLRNTRWGSPFTCKYCSGIPSGRGFPTCFQCGQVYADRPETSDLRGFVSYGWSGSQSAAVMYGYKDGRGNQQAHRVVSVMLFYALHEHLRCAATPLHSPPQMWATVPSLKHRNHPQVLHEIAAGLLRNMAEATMSPSKDIDDPRSFRPENFVVTSPVTGQHVLLIDDTWTSGGHAESAAAALKRAGAVRVTLLVLARWLDMGRGATGAFVRAELAADFDPDICPFDASSPTPSVMADKWS